MLIKIYIPKEFKGANTGNLYHTNFDHVRSELKRVFTAWTEYDAEGVWCNQEGIEFKELVKVFEVITPYFNYRSLLAFNDKLYFTLNYLKSCLNQEKIFFTENGEGKYV